MSSHSPPVLCMFPTGQSHAAVLNCANYRTDGSSMSCAIGLTAGIAQCSACAARAPIVSLSLPAAPVQAQGLRGLGDLVQQIVRILFLGRLDIAERLAGRVEALCRPRRRDVSVSLPITPRRPCGCKGRQEALNRLLPFGK